MTNRLDTNRSLTQVTSVLASTLPAPVRYNSQELQKLMQRDEFPFRPTSPAAQSKYHAVQDAVNKVRFPQYWDAELRSAIYLEEFIRRNPTWQQFLIGVIDRQGLYQRLQESKGEQLLEVIEQSVDREERFDEIVDQHASDGSLKYWLGLLMIDVASAPATYLLIRVAKRIGEVVVMCLKDYYREARPSMVCPAVVPMIDPPVTPSFPGGYALQSHLISRCLEAARRPLNQPDLLFALARRLAENRVIAGLHYPLDNEAGILAAESCFALLQQGTMFQALLAHAQLETSPRREG